MFTSVAIVSTEERARELGFAADLCVAWDGYGSTWLLTFSSWQTELVLTGGGRLCLDSSTQVYLEKPASSDLAAADAYQRLLVLKAPIILNQRELLAPSTLFRIAKVSADQAFQNVVTAPQARRIGSPIQQVYPAAWRLSLVWCAFRGTAFESLCQDARRLPNRVEDWAKAVRRDTGCNSFCLTLRWEEGEDPVFLDASVEPPPIGASKTSMGRQFMAFYMKFCAPIVIGSRCLDLNISCISEAVRLGRNAVLIPFDAIGKEWRFSFYRDCLQFHRDQQTLTATSVYYREQMMSSDGRTKTPAHEYLVTALDSWSGPVLGRTPKGWTNSSKPLQLTKHLGRALRESGSARVQLPRTYVIKGRPKLLEILREREPQLVVKSLSAWTTIAKTDDDFLGWDTKHLANLPTLFQQLISGPDVRVQTLGSRNWTSIVRYKETIDYRYANVRDPHTAHHIPAGVAAFCDLITEFEENPLMGIDFIVHPDGRYYCLEANPSPGWSWFVPTGNLYVKDGLTFAIADFLAEPWRFSRKHGACNRV